MLQTASAGGCVKLNRLQISSGLLSVIKVFLWEHFASMAAVKFLERHHRCSPMNSLSLLTTKRAWSLHLLLKKGALWQRPDVLAKWNMLALTQYLLKSCFWALDFLVQYVVIQHKLQPQPEDNEVVHPAIAIDMRQAFVCTYTLTYTFTVVTVPQQSRRLATFLRLPLKFSGISMSSDNDTWFLHHLRIIAIIWYSRDIVNHLQHYSYICVGFPPYACMCIFMCPTVHMCLCVLVHRCSL